MSGWLSAKAAFDHVLAAELVPDVAQAKLEQLIQSGKLPCRNGAGNVIASSFWTRPYRTLKADFEGGSATLTGYSLSQPAPPGEVEQVNGLEISGRHLHEIWPSTATTVEAQKPTPLRKGSGGRPGSVDWEACLIEAAVFMYRKQDPGTLAEVIAHLRTLSGNPDDSPSETAMKLHIGELWRRFKQADEGE